MFLKWKKGSNFFLFPEAFKISLSKKMAAIYAYIGPPIPILI